MSAYSRAAFLGDRFRVARHGAESQQLAAGVRPPDRLQIEGDSLVGVQEQQAVTGRGIVDAAQLGSIDTVARTRSSVMESRRPPRRSRPS